MYSVSGRMRPVCSASGMNWSGGSRPCSGCSQRTSASIAGRRRSRRWPAAGSRRRARLRSRARRRSADEREPHAGVVVVPRGSRRRGCAVRLARVHRDVGVPDQRVDVGAVVGAERDPDARLDLERQPADDDRRGQRLADLLGEDEGVGLRRDPRSPARRTRRLRDGRRCRDSRTGARSRRATSRQQDVAAHGARACR